MSFRSFPFSMNLLLWVSLLSVASISIAEEKSGYDLLLEMAIPKPHEVDLARKGVAEASKRLGNAHVHMLRWKLKMVLPKVTSFTIVVSDGITVKRSEAPPVCLPKLFQKP